MGIGAKYLITVDSNMQYVHNNYFKYIGQGKDFRTEISDLHCTTLSYFEETVRAFRLLHEQKQGNIFVFYSGGIDSEYAIAVFKHMNISVTPVIINFKDDLNSHDTHYAFKFCRNNGIEPIVIDFDFIEFIESGRILDIATKINCHAYQYTPTLECMLKFDGTIFMAEGDPYLKLNVTTNEWEYLNFERIAALNNFFQKYNIQGTPNMLSYTSGMLSAFMRHRAIRELAQGERPGRLSSFSTRHRLYNDNSTFSLETRPKFGGYEKIEQLDIFKNHPVFKVFDKLTVEYSNHDVRNYHDFMKESGLND